MIIVDTGFWLALIDQKDTYHETAKQALKKYNEPLITTWCVVTETCYNLEYLGYVAEVPELPGCVSQGKNLDEAIENIKGAIKGYLDVLEKHG